MGYGLEPHGYNGYTAAASAVYPVAVGSGEVYPGWCGRVGYREGGIPGTNPPVQPETSLRLIYIYIKINRFIRPFEA